MLCLWFLLRVLWFLGHTFRSLIHFFSLFLYMLWGNAVISLFYTWLSCFPSTSYWKDSFPNCIFLPPLSWSNHKCTGLFLGSLLCSIHLCVCFCASTILLLITVALYYSLKLGSISPALYFFFTKGPWLDRVFCSSKSILGSFFPVLWNAMEYFDRERIVDCLE